MEKKAKGKILIVDDEESLLKNMGDFLTANGYEVMSALNGNLGIEFIKTQAPDLLILDLHLKEGPPGIQILRIAKMLRPDLKIVVCTGFGEDVKSKEECFSFGIDGFLSKPVSLKGLIETIEKNIKRG